MSTLTPSPVGLDRRSEDKTLFEQLADRIAALIHDGTLRPGDRVPSVRKVKEQFRVSTATALEAFRLLESRGLIYARPQSGHFVRPPAAGAVLDEPEASAPSSRPCAVEVPLSFRMNATLRDPGKVQLGSALPDMRLMPLAAVARALARVTRNQPRRVLGYELPMGMPELRRAIARRLIDAGCTVSPDEVAITNGANESLSLALRAVTRPGDTVAIESPTYYSLIEILHTMGLKALPLPAHPKHGVSIEAARRALRQGQIRAAAFVPLYNNPLGSCVDPDRGRALAKLFAEHDVPLIEDDTYGEMPHHGPRPTALKAFDTTGHVIHCSSLSKTISPGLRIGWCVGGRYHARIVQLKAQLNHMAMPAAQLAAAEYLATAAYDRHLRKLRRALGDHTSRTADAVARYFPTGTRVTRPLGGQVLWVELPKAASALQLFEEAAQRKIGVAPGPMFGVRENEFSHFIRLNCGVVWSDEVNAALQTLGQLVHAQLD